MIKFIGTLLVVCYFLVAVPDCLEAAPPRRSQHEDTVTESIWDWATTLGKSAKDKKTVKTKRRIKRARKRAEKKARIEEAKREKDNKARIREEQRIRDARIRAKRKESQIRDDQ